MADSKTAGVDLTGITRPLQLSIRSFDRFLTIHLLRVSLLLVAIVSQRSQSLRQDGMREMVAGVHPVCVHGAEVLDLQLDQGAGKVFGVAELDGEFICWQY